jgi:hypothetical protein
MVEPVGEAAHAQRPFQTAGVVLADELEQPVLRRVHVGAELDQGVVELLLGEFRKVFVQEDGGEHGRAG